MPRPTPPPSTTRPTRARLTAETGQADAIAKGTAVVSQRDIAALAAIASDTARTARPTLWTFAAVDLSTVLAATAFAAGTAITAISLNAEAAKFFDAQPQVHRDAIATPAANTTSTAGHAFIAGFGATTAFTSRPAIGARGTASIDDDVLADIGLFRVNAPAADAGRKRDAGVIAKRQAFQSQIALGGADDIGLAGRHGQIGGVRQACRCQCNSRHERNDSLHETPSW